MSNAVYRTVDIVAAIRAYFDVITDEEATQDADLGGLGFMRFLAAKFPKAQKEEVIRAWTVFQDEFRQEQLEDEAEIAEGEAMCRIMERAEATPDMTYQQALQKLAAEGDADAIQRLLDLQSPEVDVFMALLEAAANLHPAWGCAEPGRFTHDEEQGGPASPNALIDWFQSTHPQQASQIENHYRVA